jgi:hypothetical protein
MVRLASEGLRSVGAASPSKSVCSILPLARRWRAGEIFSGSTPARGSPLLSSAALGGPILQRGLRFAPSLRDSGLSVTMPGGGTRLGEEVKDGPHGDNRGGGNRFGVAPTAAPLRSRAGILRGSGLYTVLGRAFCTHPPWRGPSHCALEALRMIVNGATMTTPTQWGGHGRPAATPPCSAHWLLSWGWSSHGAQVTELRPFALPHPKHLRTLPDSPAVLAHNTRWCEHPLFGVPGLSGWGDAALAARTSPLRSSRKFAQVKFLEVRTTKSVPP